MKGKYRKNKTLPIIYALSALMLNPTMVLADDLGSITIDYTDDSGQSKPVKGAVFRLYRIADIETTVDSSGVNAYDIRSLISGLDIDSDTDAKDVLEHFKYHYKTESLMEIEDWTKSGDKLDYEEAETDEDGEVKFKNLKYGVYFGIEVDAANDHVLSQPFLISVANTDKDGEESKTDLKVSPKAILAGDLRITKELKGNNTDSTTQWSMQVKLPDGKYSYSLSNGENGIMESGDIVKIKGGESVYIDDIISGNDYSVQELEANKNGYKTTIENGSGEISYKEVKDVKVVNQRDNFQFVDTKDSSDEQKEMVNASIICFAIIISALLITGLLMFKLNG